MDKIHDLKDVAVISGKPGLYKIVKPSRTGVIVETIGTVKNKLITNASHKVSILKEISIYTTVGEGSVPLEDVFYSIFEKFKGELSIKKDASDAVLRNFMFEVLPDNDVRRVHISDIKKLISWYDLLVKFHPEIMDRNKPNAEVAAKETAPQAQEVVAEATTVVSEEKKKVEKVAKPAKAEKVADVAEIAINEKPKKTAKKVEKVLEVVAEPTKETTIKKTAKKKAEPALATETVVAEEKPKKTRAKK